MTRPRTLDDLRQYVARGAAKIQEGFTDPDGDWEQILFVQNEEGVGVVEMPDGVFDSELAKDILSEVLVELVARLGAYRYALLLNTWMVKLDTPEEIEAAERAREAGARVSSLPGAFEQLLLILGDAEEEQVWAAKITRPPDGTPSLEEWERMDAEGMAFAGRFVGLNASLGRRR